VTVASRAVTRILSANKKESSRWTSAYHAIAINIGQSVVVGTRRPLELHVANIVARFDNDPSVKMYLEAITY
jgi:hypothetical protein